MTWHFLPMMNLTPPPPSATPTRVPRLPDLVGRALERVETAPAATSGPVRGIATPTDFAVAVWDASARSGGDLLVSVWLQELPHLLQRYGGGFAFECVTDLTLLLQRLLAPNDAFTVAEDGEIMILAFADGAADERIEVVCREIARRRFDELGERVHLTPVAGLVVLDDDVTPAEALRRSIAARAVAIPRTDGQVQRWEHIAPAGPTSAAAGAPSLPARLLSTQPRPDAEEMSPAEIAARLSARLSLGDLPLADARREEARPETSEPTDAAALPRRFAEVP